MISPCVQICVILPATGLCTGCGRTLDEIAGWSGYPESERLRIMADLPQRMADIRGNGGAAGGEGMPSGSKAGSETKAAGGVATA